MKTFACLLTSTLLAASLAGCGNKVSHSSITRNLTPELKGVAERPSDDRNAFAVTNNQNRRMFWDDLGRTLYLDQPSRLSPYPITYTSGQPR